MAETWRSSGDAMDQDISLDDLDRWDVAKERQKFRRYRTRHLPSNSILARDLQIPGKVEAESLIQAAVEDEPMIEKEESPFVAPVPVRKPIKYVKEDPDDVADSGDLSFGRFASAFDSWLRGFTPMPELLQEFEAICRDLAEVVRDEASEKHRVVEDRLMRQKAQMLHSEAASWALLWHLFAKPDEETGFQSPNTSAQIARDFLKNNEVAQICFRLVQWLEGLASKELDLEKKRKGWYAGSYTEKLGLWDQTKRAIRKNVGTHFVRHLDPDAPTREGSQIHREDRKLEEGLLEDVWKLLRAGRVTEAQNLCRTSGQAWRAASLGGCLMGYSPFMESTGNERALEAIELDGGIGWQRTLWKWACYCASEKISTSDGGKYESAVFAAQCGNVNRLLPVCTDWESAFWALARSWVDTQIEAELSGQRESASGPESWPEPVLDQQPRDFVNLFQKLYSGNLVNESVRRSCKEQHRLVQMDIVLSDITDLLELLKTWILPQEDRSTVKPHGHPQMIRFAAHLVLVLRSILPGPLKEQYHDKLELVGDLILNTYAIFLFTEHKEELVGAYASNLAPHLCVDLYVHMMELRQNESELVKRKIVYSALEYLPFYPDDGKGSISAICERFLEKTREAVTKETPEAHHANVQKCHALQWLCFTPPVGLEDSAFIRAELLARALNHSNVLFREISLASLWRSVEVPEGAHILFGHLAEPLKTESDVVLLHESYSTKENYQEFLDWQEYFSCDAHYRRWLATVETFETFDSPEEQSRSLAAAKQSLKAAAALVQRSEGQWLSCSESIGEGELHGLELSVTAALSNPEDPHSLPDATVCTALTSALYLCVGESASIDRQLTVDVRLHPNDEGVLKVGLKCAAVEGEGFHSLIASDGGFLAVIMAAAVKGELSHFQPGVALEILRLDAWWIQADGVRNNAPFLVRGLCRRCCIPELMLRSMQIRAWLPAAEETDDFDVDDLVEIVAQRGGLHGLFSTNQLEEFLLLEREIVLRRMEAAEEEEDS